MSDAAANDPEGVTSADALADEMIAAFGSAFESSYRGDLLQRVYEGAAAEIHAVANHLEREFKPDRGRSSFDGGLSGVIRYLRDQAHRTTAKAATVAPGSQPD